MTGAPRIPSHLPENTGDQVFQAPWEARAFAMVVNMSRRGLFEWDEFRSLLIEEIGRADAAAEPSSGSSSTYYVHWLTAAERLMAAKAFASGADLASSKDEIVAQMESERHDHDH